MADPPVEAPTLPVETRAALRESQEIFRLLVERVQDYAIFLIDTNGHIATWNVGAQRIKGYAADQIIGQAYEVFFTPQDRAAGKPQRLLGTARREGRVEDEGWRVRADGQLFWADAVLTALYDDAGVLRGYAKVTRDLTERRRLEGEKAARLAAEQSVRDRDAFLSVAAHELKTPVSSVRLLADLALRRIQRLGGARPEDTRTALERIGAQTERLTQLIERLLDFSRIEGGRLRLEATRVDLTRLVHEAAANAGVAWPEHQFAIRAPGTLWIEADDLRLEQVLVNLLGNAAKYSPVGRQVEVDLSARDGVARLGVRDHGSGIPEEDRPHLFERFFRGHASSYQSGLGLGLYITYQIVELHHGSVRAEFPEDGGTRLVVELPLKAAAPPAADRANGSERGLGRVPLVEDDATAREALAASLTDEG